MRTKRLGDMLIELGLLTNDQLKQALEIQAKEKDRLGTTLVKHNFITEHQLIDALRMQLGIDYIDLTKRILHRKCPLMCRKTWLRK